VEEQGAMVMKDYYKILGVPRTASITSIRVAFRKLAKEHHPDRSGPEATRSFQDIAEAYWVLTRPETRRTHDQDLLNSERREQIQAGRKRRGAALATEQPRAEPISERGHLRSPGLSAASFLEDILSGFSGIPFVGGRRQDTLRMEVFLSLQEAAQGGILPVPVPVPGLCPFCQGRGRNRGFLCPHCNGQGMIRIEQTFRISIPPGIADGAVFDVAIRPPHGRDGVLRIYVRVEEP